VIFVLVGFATSIIWTWIVNNAKGSILIAILLHSASNANTALLGKLLPVPAPAVFQEGTLLIYGAYVVCALVVIIFTRGRLSYKAGNAEQTIDASQAAVAANTGGDQAF
jgi:membrane protease YdiL (CAAX protease family)